MFAALEEELSSRKRKEGRGSMLKEREDGEGADADDDEDLSRVLAVLLAEGGEGIGAVSVVEESIMAVLVQTQSESSKAVRPIVHFRLLHFTGKLGALRVVHRVHEECRDIASAPLQQWNTQCVSECEVILLM